MKLHAFFAFAAAVTVFAVGCANGQDEASPDESPASAAEDLTSQSVLAGTFELNGTTDATNFYSLTLKNDHSFKAMGGCRPGGTGAHCFAITAISGEWKTKKSGPQLGAPGGAAQLELTDSFGQVTTYFYSLKSDQLSLTTTIHGTASLFDKDVSHLPKLRSFDVCADKYDNSLGRCPEDLPCEFDGPDGNTQRCLPPI